MTATRATVSSDLLDDAIRFLKVLPKIQPSLERDHCRRAGQQLRLMSQLVRTGTKSIDEGLAWHDAARLSLRRYSDVRSH